MVGALDTIDDLKKASKLKDTHCLNDIDTNAHLSIPNGNDLAQTLSTLFDGADGGVEEL